MKPYLSLGEAIESFLDQHGLRDDADMHQILTDWEQLMGRPVATQTEKIWFEQGVLFIRISNPVWKNELTLARIKIRDMINQRVGRELVTEVRVF
ncbi:MAG: DUF721 domain-containing protein [Bacteroidetes bacterium]|nr:MAG: DUF721 domain-containing protein [Bacteroidota bacterium]